MSELSPAIEKQIEEATAEFADIDLSSGAMQFDLFVNLFMKVQTIVRQTQLEDEEKSKNDRRQLLKDGK